MEQNLSNWHYAYMDMIRHWHPESEKYTGGDALFTALENGWEISKDVRFEEYWHAGVRSVLVYHFELTRGDETMVMPVIRNPYVNRIVREMPAQLIPVGNDDTDPTLRLKSSRL
ncbi:MAG TPA: hypothetical protein VHO69_08430 [Phototrophicaceae bacterium]|nr:hypothetical protein [Phototrophicaceae bacterium]